MKYGLNGETRPWPATHIMSLVYKSSNIALKLKNGLLKLREQYRDKTPEHPLGRGTPPPEPPYGVLPAVFMGILSTKAPN